MRTYVFLTKYESFSYHVLIYFMNFLHHFISFSSNSITQLIIVWILVKLRPKMTDICVENIFVFAGAVPSWACLWPIQCPEIISGLWTLPTLTVPVDLSCTDCAQEMRKSVFQYNSWTFFVISFHSVPTGFYFLLYKMWFCFWIRHTQNIGQLRVNQKLSLMSRDSYTIAT